MSTLAERIEAILQRTGLTSSLALSKAAKLSEAHVGQMQNGKILRPREPTVRKLAAFANVTEEWLREGKGTIDDLGPYVPGTAEARMALIEGSNPGGDRVGKLASWPKLRERAKIEAPDIPDDIWDIVASRAPYMRTTTPSVAAIVAMARLILLYEDPPDESGNVPS